MPTDPTDILTILAAIRETTEKATPGEWRIDYNPDESPNLWIVSADNDSLCKFEPCDKIGSGVETVDEQDRSDAAHIAACSPANMTKFLAAFDALTAKAQENIDLAATMHERAEKAEKERDEALEEVERLTGEPDMEPALRAEVARLTAECEDTATHYVAVAKMLAERDATIARLRLLLRTAADSLSGPHPVLRTEINAAISKALDSVEGHSAADPRDETIARLTSELDAERNNIERVNTILTRKPIIQREDGSFGSEKDASHE